MQQLVTQYRIENSRDFWPEVTKLFKSNLSACGAIFFKGKSEAEIRFAQFCKQHELKIDKKYFLECSGEFQRPFYYFSVQDTREHDYGFIQMNCHPADKSLCFAGAVQVRKVSVDQKIAAAVDKCDIVVKNWPPCPRTYIISRRLKELMEQEQFSGCKFLPCLNAGEKYSDQETEFLSDVKNLNDSAKYFQLKITTITKGPPMVGKATAGHRCSCCQTAKTFFAEKEERFKPEELHAVDFQYFNSVATENEGIISVAIEIPIISAKAFQFLVDNRIRGIKPYSKDPPVKYAAVLFIGENF